MSFRNAGAGNQGNAVSAFPPFPYEICLINIETILLYEVAEILYANCNVFFMGPPFLEMCAGFMLFLV